MRLICIVICLIVPWPAVLAREETLELDLATVVELALSHNIDLQKDNQKLALLDEKIKEAQARKWVNVDFGSRYTRLSDVMEMNFPGAAFQNLPFPIPNETIRFGDENDFEFSFDFTQPIYTGGALKSGAQAARQEMLSMKEQQQVRKNLIVFQAKNAFFQLIKALEFQKITQISIQQIQTHLNDVNNFLEQGQVTRNEVLAVEVKLSEAELMSVQAKKNIRLTQLALLLLLNQDLRFNVRPIYQVAEWNASDPLVPGSFQVERKAEMMALQHQINALQLRHQGLQGTKRPSLGIFARYIYGKPALDKIRNEWMGYWLVGLNLKWKVWDWGRKSAQVQQMQKGISEMELTRNQLKNKLLARLQQARLTFRESKEQLQIALRMVALAQENFRIISNRFQQGIISNAEFLDAQAELTRSQLQKVQYQINVQIARADLERGHACQLGFSDAE